MMQRPPGTSYDSDDIAARYGFERRISRAVDEVRRARPAVTSEMIQAYQDLIYDCHIMKGALFNASKRLERMHAAGQYTFALSGIYGFLVPLFALQFEPFLTALVTNVVSFTAATAGAISFVVAMIYQQLDLGRQSREYHAAGLKMNKLRRHLKATPLSNPGQLDQSIHIYDDILVACQNHDDIDFEYAKLGAPPENNEHGALDAWRSNRRKLYFKSLFKTYRLLAVVWIGPPLTGLAIWLSLSGHISTASQIAR